MKKIIFLDFDVVLNTETLFESKLPDEFKLALEKYSD